MSRPVLPLVDISRRREKVMLKNIFRSLAMAASLLCAFSASAQAGNAPLGVQMVELDGKRLRVQTIGLEKRQPGTPVIVFEAGATRSLEDWRHVLPQVAEMAPVVAYDRSGLGQSEWDGIRPTPRHATGKLRRLLKLVGAEPPYLLVGHSWGGMLVHYYAGYYPAEIAGLVFVDPGPVLTQELSGNLAPFEAIGAGRAGYEAYWSVFSNLASRGTPAMRAEFDVLRELVDSPLPGRDLRSLPKVPITMIVAAKYRQIPFDYPFDARAYFEADLRHRMKLLQEWALASDNGTFLVSRATSHSVPREDPQLIGWSVSRVLQTRRSTNP